LQRRVQAWTSAAESRGVSRTDIFHGIRERAFEVAGMPLPPLDLADDGEVIPRLSENWYCCAEPTCEQLNSF
jgi:hypothetical protein